jgi:hypothetical protein
MSSINTSAPIKGTLTISADEMDHAAIHLPSKIYYTKVRSFSSDYPSLQTGSINNYVVRSRNPGSYLAYDLFMLWVSPILSVACWVADSLAGRFLERDKTQMSLLLENQPLAEAEEELQKKTDRQKGYLCIPVELQIERQSNKEIRVLRTVFEQHRKGWISRAPSFSEVHKHRAQIVARVSEEAWRVFQAGIARRSNQGPKLPMEIKVLPSDLTYYQKTWFQRTFGSKTKVII